jgi:hypothetical protein
MRWHWRRWVRWMVSEIQLVIVFLSKYYKSWMWETEIVENCGNVALTIASCFIFSELRESLSSVVKICSWAWSIKKCVRFIEMSGFGWKFEMKCVTWSVFVVVVVMPACVKIDISICECCFMWRLQSDLIYELDLTLQTVIDIRSLRKFRTHYRWWLSVECWTWTCASALEMRTVCAVDVVVGTCLSKYASSRVRFHYVLTLFDRMSALIWFNMRNV